MSYPPIMISDDEEDDDAVPPSFPSLKRRRRNPPPSPNPTIFNLDEDVTVVKSSFGPGGEGVISLLDSDSEDAPQPATSNNYGPVHIDSLEQQPCRLQPVTSDTDSDNSTDWLRGPSSQSSPPKLSIEVDSDQEIEDIGAEKMGFSQKQASGSQSPSLSGKAVPRKRLSKDERIRATEENKLRREQEKLQKAASKAEEAEKRKLDKEMRKLEKGKLALKSIVVEIDLLLVEGALGAPLLSLFAEKGIRYRVTSNPIKSSIVWKMTLPEGVSQSLPLGPIPYILLVYEAAEFCNLVANERLLENLSRVRDQYPFYTVCYLTNNLISYVKKRENEGYKNVGKSNVWSRPPIDEMLAKLSTHYDGVHSRHCIDGPEVAAHVVGLTSSLASCQFRKKSSWLSVNAEGVVASMDSVDKHLIKKSPWLKALVAIPKVQPRFAVAVGKKYPTMKSLLKVYMDPNKSEREKEVLLKDLKLEGLTGDDRNLGPAGSKRIYRVLMSTAGALKTDEVED